MLKELIGLVNIVSILYYMYLMTKFPILLERLSTLQRSMMRKFAAEQGLQTVHVEILNYLCHCNHYSNTTQALTEYLGQTKGSISQSLGLLETMELVKRTQDPRDRRVFHLHLTAKAYRIVEDYENNYSIDISRASDAKSLSMVLQKYQAKHGFRGFGLCGSCKYNEVSGKDDFVCGLTQERLTKEDTLKRCREHESA